MTKGYVIAHVSVSDPEAFRLYVENNPTVVERYGGKFIVKGGAAEVAEGTSYATHVVIEFPSYEDAKAFYYEPVYQEVARFRHTSGDSVLILVEGADPG